MTNFRRKWLIALPVLLLQFFIFKQLYPFASFFQDSYTYLYAAIHRHVISFRPIGYSWFLLLIHSISTSDTFLVFVQYCLLQGAGLYLYFSIDKLYRPRKVIGNILFYFLLLDPVTLYLANVVSSDALFVSLTLVWLTGLLRMIHRPSWQHLAVQLVLLVLIFFIRYNALCYPVITAVAFLLTRKGWVFKVTGIAGAIMVLMLGVAAVREINRKETGVRIFSAFSGWQIANNALYVYPYIKVDTLRLPSPECRERDRIVRESPGHLPVDTWYMWDPNSPLKKYMFMRQRREQTDYFTAWNRVAPVFSQYGYYLMSRHPLLFCREYGWPSTLVFFYPPLEVLMRYNEGEKNVDLTAKEWFHYNSTAVMSVCSPDVQGRLLAPLPAFYLLINLAFVPSAICFLFFRKMRDDDPGFRKGLLMTLVYFGVNAAFCIFAAPGTLRYQLASMMWLMVFTLLTCDRLVRRSNPGPAARKE